MKCDLLSLVIVEGKIHPKKTLATDVADAFWQGKTSKPFRKHADYSEYMWVSL